MYSYDRRTATTRELKDLSPKFLRALKSAIRGSRVPAEKSALQEAARQFDQVIDNLQVAEAEFDLANREG